MKVQVDSYTRFILTAIAVLLTVVAVGLWCESPTALPQAQAGIPNQGQQLQDIVAQLQVVNESVNGLAATLLSGNVRVQVIEPEKATPARAAATTTKIKIVPPSK